MANSDKFWHMTLELVECLLKFELVHKNVLQPVRKLWCKETTIPMGGPFFAQSTDLFTPWKNLKAGKCLQS